MPDNCQYCGSEIRVGGILKADNQRLLALSVEIINFINNTDYPELCELCGTDLYNETVQPLNIEMREKKAYFDSHLLDFPIMTIGSLPMNIHYKVKSLVTANVTVGTGFFNEFSQGFSDLFGAVNSGSGMAHKVNSGEAAARSIVIGKAVSLGANAIIAVDIDYGTTMNNAATVNLQGTAVKVDDLELLLDSEQALRAAELESTISRIAELTRWFKGDFSKGGECV